MTVNPADKMVTAHEPKIEKWLLRKHLKICYQNRLLENTKEQFSDGVGYSWIDYFKRNCRKEVTDEMMANAKFRFPQNTPQNKEEYRYRTIFEEHFPSETAALTVPSVPSVACSTPIALNGTKLSKNE